MAYSTPENVADTYPRTFTAGFTPEQLRLLINDADAYINARLAGRYNVPFAGAPNAPPLIATLSRILAVADVLDRSQTAADWVIRRLERAYMTLDQLATGDLVLVDAAGNRIPIRTDIGTPHSTTEGFVPTFGVAPTISETVDPVRADLEDAARR